MSGFDIPTTVRGTLYRRSLGRCERCGARGTDAHHRKRGNPRLHWIQNLVRLCRTCHRWATIQPTLATRTGWVVMGQATPEKLSGLPVALLGRFWATLDPSGVYRFGDVALEHIGQVLEQVRIEPTAPGLDDGLAQALGPAVIPSTLDDAVRAQSHSLGGLGFPPVHVDIPAGFLVKPRETVEDFLARLDELL